MCDVFIPDVVGMELENAKCLLYNKGIYNFTIKSYEPFKELEDTDSKRIVRQKITNDPEFALELVVCNFKTKC